MKKKKLQSKHRFNNQPTENYINIIFQLEKKYSLLNVSNVVFLDSVQNPMRLFKNMYVNALKFVRRQRKYKKLTEIFFFFFFNSIIEIPNIIY